MRRRTKNIFHKGNVQLNFNIIRCNAIKRFLPTSSFIQKTCNSLDIALVKKKKKKKKKICKTT